MPASEDGDWAAGLVDVLRPISLQTGRGPSGSLSLQTGRLAVGLPLPPLPIVS